MCFRNLRNQVPPGRPPYQLAITNLLPNSVWAYVSSADDVFLLQLPDNAATEGWSSTNVNRFSNNLEPILR